MNTKISFLIIQNKNEKEPYIYFDKKENGEYILPTFQMENDEYDIDSFIGKNFESITKVKPIDRNGFGWISLFLTGTIVYDKSFSFVYICKIPDEIKINVYTPIKMSTILENKDIDQDYMSQVINNFNSLYVR